MGDDIDIRLQYNMDSVVLFEYEDGEQYEIARWIEDEISETNGLAGTIDNLREMVENNPESVVEKLYGSVSNWRAKRDKRSLN